MAHAPLGEAQEGVKRLFYVPVSISMIWNAVQDVDECKIDGFDVKSVIFSREMKKRKQ